MPYLQRVPPPPLDAFVASIWIWESDPRPLALERILPSGAANLIVNLQEDQQRLYEDQDHDYRCATTPGAVLSGPRSRYCIIDTAEQQHVAGVAFKPGGSAAFFNLPAQETCNQDVPLELMWGRRGATLRERLLDAPGPQAKLDALQSALTDALTPGGIHPAVAFALQRFQRGNLNSSIADVSGHIALSRKRFIERFKATVGVAPKQYCRILRFQQALRLAERNADIDWTRVAMDCGYFDQAHFIRDFRSFSGITPTGYRAQRTEFRNHVKFIQSIAVSS